MIRAATLSEWIKLRRLSTLWILVGATLLTVLISVLTFSNVGSSSGGGPGPASASLAELESASGIVAGLGQAADLLGLLVLGLFAYGFASEFSLGTVRNLLVRQPSRLRLLAGKWLGLSAFAVLVAASATLFSVAVALLIGPGSGVDTSAWSFGAAVSGFAEGALALVGFGTIGAVLGLVLRSPVVAVVAGAIYLLPFESVLAGAWDTGNSWLPGKLLAAIIAGGNETIDLGPALLRASLIVGVLAIASAVLFRRRDLTE
jgi:ABC-2 type transport system permease protein